jgi:endonuclease/exonuclease/phosphatase (EEP) superfamily protein YafD
MTLVAIEVTIMRLLQCSSIFQWNLPCFMHLCTTIWTTNMLIVHHNQILSKLRITIQFQRLQHPTCLTLAIYMLSMSMLFPIQAITTLMFNQHHFCHVVKLNNSVKEKVCYCFGFYHFFFLWCFSLPLPIV